MPLRIEDYGMIGDCHSAALVGRNGSVDWLCMPRFDSAACFAALLGKPEHGRWLIAPREDVRKTRRWYRDESMILETEFETESGTVRLIDLMPLRDDVPRLIRVVEGVRGRVPMRLELIMRFDYGWMVPWVRKLKEGGIFAIAGPDTLRLRTEVPLRGENLTTVGEFEVSEGQKVPFVLSWHLSHEPPPAEVDGIEAIDQTAKFWKDWAAKCTYEGPWRDTVVRSLVTLKALTYAPSGGIAAAPTTSLPEQIGSVRNWDYRFCWLRDATFTLMSLMAAGFTEEAGAWREWLLRSIAGKASQIQILYGMAGERRLTELELDWLPGYENSKPVRIGNAAATQLQLDVYGEVIDSMYQCRRVGLEPAEAAWRLETQLLDYLESHWQDPDEGIWEVRGPRRDFTHSKVMAWVAMDRAVKSVEELGLKGPLDRWKALRGEIHREVCEKGFDPKRNTFVQYFGGKTLDAAVLMIPLVGFLPADDPRVRGTVAAIEKHLMVDGFVMRYSSGEEVDHLPAGQGAFLPCSFWYCDNLALLGRLDEARSQFERLLGLCNDLGLIAEEYDPHAKRLLGNFPQAFTHVSLVNTACNLAHAEGPAKKRQSDGGTGTG